MKNVRLIIDTDAGVDDAHAIMMALEYLFQLLQLYLAMYLWSM